MKKIATAQRVSREISDNFVFQRSLLAYHEAARLVGGEVLEIGTQSHNQSLKNFDSRVKEFHSRFSFINESCRPSVHT